MDTIPDWTVLGRGAGDQLGVGAAAAGDVNGDGAADLWIGAPYRNVGAFIDAGAAYLFYGGAAFDTTADFVIEGESGEENLGRSLAGCGDVTGSGFSHLLVGAPGSDAGGAEAGRFLLSPGGDPPDPGELIELLGEHGGDQFGYTVAGGAGLQPPSFTGASRPDIAVGSWAYGSAGKGYVYGQTGGGSGIRGSGDRQANQLRVKPFANPARTFALCLEWTTGGLEARPETSPTVLILGVDGRRVRQLPVPLGQGLPGRQRVHWDGRAEWGEPAPAGPYLYQVAGRGLEPVSGRLILVR
jgi:hypothetical protein